MTHSQTSKAELIEKLRALEHGRLGLDGFRSAGVVDPEVQHSEADDLLLAFIDDEEVTAAYEKIPKWYA